MNNNNNDIIALYIGYADSIGGKVRPILVVENRRKELVVLKITTKFNNKSDYIKQNYYKISDWKLSGLNKQSYIDTNDSLTISKDTLGYTREIGRLSPRDIAGFAKFLNKRTNRYYKKIN